MRIPIAALFIVGALAAGCRGKVTAVRIEARFANQTFDHLAFVLRKPEGGTPILEQVEKPDTDASVALTSPQDLVVYVDDSLHGASVVCTVAGLRGAHTVVRRDSRTTTVVRDQTVKCSVNLADTDVADGGAGEGGTVTDAGVGGDTGTTNGRDAARLPDGALVPDAAVRDGAATDGSVRADAPVAVDLPPGVDAPAPSPDAPVVVPPAGCADDSREAFLDWNAFPNIAGCGLGDGPVSYGQAVDRAEEVCAPDWHWCRPTDVGSLGSGAPPGQVSGSNCSWIDNSSLLSCEKKLTAYGSLDCQGNPGQTASAGGPSGGTLSSCTLAGIDPMCAMAWKLTIPLTRYNDTSVGGSGVSCLNHLAFDCAGGVGPANCWITCCRD